MVFGLGECDAWRWWRQAIALPLAENDSLLELVTLADYDVQGGYAPVLN